MHYENVTIDIESTDTANTSKILSIGVVPFNWGENVSFDELCNRESSLYLTLDLSTFPASFTESASKMEWWERQGEAARHVLAPSPTDISIKDALLKLHIHLCAHVLPLTKDGGQVFCRGYDFDGGILEHAYEQLELLTPWTYNRFRCVRTAIDILADSRNGYVVEKNPAGFIKHHALHDAAKDTLTMLALNKAHQASSNTAH